MRQWSKKKWVIGIMAGTLLLSGGANASTGIKLVVNGQEIISEVPPQIIDGTTLIPARYLAEALGAEVKWDEKSRTIVVSSKGSPAETLFTYTAKSYTVTMPHKWESRISIAEQEQKTLFYYVPKNATVEREVLFSVETVSNTEWDELAEVGFFTKLGSKQDKVYVLHLPSENPYAAKMDGVEYTEVHEMLLQAKKVISLTVHDDKQVQETAYPELTITDAVQLAGKAAANFWYIASGGGGHSQGVIEEFALGGKGDHYRWLGSDLDTKAKLVSLLAETYTPAKVEEFWKKQEQLGQLVEVNGKLAQPNADGGSLMLWSKATAELLEDGTSSKKFLFIVPLGESEIIEQEVSFRYVENIGWRLDEDIATIR